MIQATATALMNQFANNLKKQLGEQPAATAPSAARPMHSSPIPPPAPDAPPAAAPISGFSLMAQVLWNSIKRLFGTRP
jgi:hypothetical protein